MNHKSMVIGFAAVFTLQLQIPVFAGALEPPGTPGPTFKTLGEIEPRIAIKANPDVVEAIVIDQPGSYYLVEDITAIPDNNALTITANDVTLDLNGFTVRGNLETTDGHGIDVSGNNVSIRNGTVRFADMNGINCTGKLLKLYDVSSMNNGVSGLACSEARVINGDFYQNGQIGIVGNFNYLEGVRATENGLTGVAMSGRSVLSRALVNNNGDFGTLCVQGGASLVFQSFISGNGLTNNFGCIASEGTYVAPDPP